ncbi:MAG: hypothetical protein N2645_23010 [Clostridia bacterium]|nr:hypothetical protein [Clostridia bacterium]
MPEIYANFQSMQILSNQLKGIMDNLSQIEREIQTTMNSLSWDVPEKAQVLNQVHTACRNASRIAEQTFHIKQFVLKAANALEETDNRLSNELSHSAGILDRFSNFISGIVPKIYSALTHSGLLIYNGLTTITSIITKNPLWTGLTMLPFIHQLIGPRSVTIGPTLPPKYAPRWIPERKPVPVIPKSTVPGVTVSPSAPPPTAAPSAKPSAAPPAKPASPSASKPVPGNNAPSHTFNTSKFPGFYDASKDKTNIYNIPSIVKDIPNMWASYGESFKKIGSEMGVDPYALAAYCVFESYNCNTHNFNPKMQDVGGGMHAAGIGATQAQYVKGTQVPGLNISLPNDTQKASDMLRNNPEYSIRYLADEFKGAYSKEKDLAKAFPKVAYPNWGDPNRSRGSYGTQAEYVSRAYVFYEAFRSADRK